MSNNEPYVRWEIDPDNLTLRPIDQEPKRGAYNGNEWARQVWPMCPVCGTPVEVQRIEVTSLSDFVGSYIDRQYMMGYWECRNECDPRPALWGEDWRTRKS